MSKEKYERPEITTEVLEAGTLLCQGSPGSDLQEF
jgi:hypothetical protein